jgi:hypothetical protein
VGLLQSWTELSIFDLVRLLGPAGILVASAFVPGVGVGRLAALGVAVTIPFLRELGADAVLTAGWVVLWLLVAWSAGAPVGVARRPVATTRSAVESGMVGLALGAVLLGLLIAAVARQDLSPEDARRASYGALLIVTGILHLMLRRHARRAGVGFASLGLGLQVLDGAARAAQVPGTLPAPGAVLVVTVIAAALTIRVAMLRERMAGTAWVSDAHDLHD